MTMASNSNMNPVPSDLPYPNEIQKLPMFYPHLNKQKAEQLLLQHNQGEGTFLIRPNGSQDPSVVSISLSGTDNKVYRVRAYIDKDSKGLFTYYIKPSKKFSSFHDLLKHYRRNEICFKQQHVDNLYLLHPLIVENEGKKAKRENLNQVSGTTGFRKVGRSSFLVPTELEAKDIECQNIITKSTDPNTTQPSHQGGLRKKQRSHSIPLLIKDKGTGKRKTTFFNRKKFASESHDSMISKSPCEARREGTESLVPEKDSNYRTKDFNHCRPPAPLPRLPETECDPNFVYSQPDIIRDRYEEIYQRLKEADLCECGLRLIDSELSDGWAVHRSNDEATDRMIFFQKGDNATWDLPRELLPLLTENQIDFILFLCLGGRSRIPPALKKFIKEKKLKNTQKKVMNSSHDSSPYVLPSSSSSSKTSTNDRESLLLGDASTEMVSSINSSTLHSSPDYPNDLVNYETTCSLFDNKLMLNDASSTKTAQDAMLTVLPSSIGQLSGMIRTPNSSSSTGYPIQVVYIPVSHTAPFNQPLQQQQQLQHIYQVVQHQQLYGDLQTPQLQQQQQQPQNKFYHQQPQQAVQHEKHFQEQHIYQQYPQQFHPQQQWPPVMIQQQNDPHHHLTENQQYIQHDSVHTLALSQQQGFQQQLHMDLIKQQQLLKQGQSVNHEHPTRSHPLYQQHMLQQKNPLLITKSSNVRCLTKESPNIMQNQYVHHDQSVLTDKLGEAQP